MLSLNATWKWTAPVCSRVGRASPVIRAAGGFCDIECIVYVNLLSRDYR